MGMIVLNNKLLFVYNPYSGKSKIKNKLGSIIEKLANDNWEIRVHPTKGVGDAANVIASEGKRYDYIVVGGGDGTMNEAATGMMSVPEDKRCPIGYIPTGTTNDFASSMGIPKTIDRASDLTIKGTPRACDIGAFNEKYFLYVAAFGAFTEVTYETSQKTKNMLGYAAYLMEGVKSLPSIKSHHLRITYNGDKVVEGDYVLGIISNSTSVAGMKYSKKLNVSMNDGEFECILIKNPPNPIEFQLTLGDLIMQNMDSPRIDYFKFFKAEMESEESVKWTLDGEFGGEHTRVEIENIKSAINVVC